MAKIVVVTGGVVSSLGKGIAAASLGLLLKARGFRVTTQKLDPYLNIDPGTMSPFQHGEVFVTDDGAETDLALGRGRRAHRRDRRHGRRHRVAAIPRSGAPAQARASQGRVVRARDPRAV